MASFTSGNADNTSRSRTEVKGNGGLNYDQ